MGKYIINRISNGVMLISVVFQSGILLYLESAYGPNSDISCFEAFLLYINSTANIVFLGLSLVLAMGYPQNIGNENIITRMGLKKWMKYEIISYMFSVFVLELSILVVDLLITFSFSTSWSRDFLLCSNCYYAEFGSRLSGVSDIKGFVIFSNPIISTIISFISHWLLVCVCGLVVMMLNQNSKKIISIAVPLIMINLPGILFFVGENRQLNLFTLICRYADISENANLDNMRIHGFGGVFSVAEYAIVMLIIIIMIADVIVIRRKKCLS